jgi:putative component of membrane protein insertase Oxa1/YidC/SpoIIIJ protein YidD
VKFLYYITIIIFSLLFQVNLFPQDNSGNDLYPIKVQKWQASEVSYQIQDKNSKGNSVSSLSIIDGVQYMYKLLISDVDGDNCPFQPTCSAFFVQAVKSTNIFQGALMSADRLTRDLNIVKNHYPITFEGYFIDPPGNYVLDKDRINLLPHDNK